MDCSSSGFPVYHELLIAKFRLKLKKVEKTTRPFRYDLNQIPYNYHNHIPGGSEGKAPAYSTGDLGSIPGQEDPLENEMATHSSTLA